MISPGTISAAVEGILDDAVFRRLMKDLGAIAGTVYGKHGKSFLLEKLSAAYTSVLIEFTADPKKGWRPHVAAKESDSLNRCLHRLTGLIRGA